MPGFSTREVDLHSENDETWRVLKVNFLDYYPTHSKTQLVYFEKEFILRKLDYAPLAFKVPASHYCCDFQEMSGLKIRVLRRGSGAVSGSEDVAVVTNRYSIFYLNPV